MALNSSKNGTFQEQMTVEGKPPTLSQKSLYAGPSTRQGGVLYLAD
jgi:hypothetical protein